MTLADTPDRASGSLDQLVLAHGFETIVSKPVTAGGLPPRRRNEGSLLLLLRERASHALALRATEPLSEDDVATGFLLFVDPSRERPVAIIELTGETWTAFDTARRLGGWRELYSAVSGSPR